MVEALRPLDIDVGPEVRAAGGYRKKVRMITFAWCLTSVDGKIDALPRPERKQAASALKYLLKMPRDNEYSDYYRRHKAFLRQHREDPAGTPARRPLHFLEVVGLETALWPHLYTGRRRCASPSSV
jgi:hypothetical protein